MGLPDFEGYCRRVDAFEYRRKLKDFPRDITELLELTREIEAEDKIILAREDYRE